MPIHFSSQRVLAATTLAAFCILSFSTASPAQNLPQNARAKADAAAAARREVLPPRTDFLPRGVIRQDLYDRNNPNNLRSDYPAPPAQPGQF